VSADKGKKKARAMVLLREVQRQKIVGVDGAVSHSGNGRFSPKNPTVRYIVERGLGMLKRVTYFGSRSRSNLLIASDAEQKLPTSRRANHNKRQSQ
jgi:hypothetical protein